MKIEKVNEHQIRCTLTREDLANRKIKLSELAYGTDKAKELFRDMMQQAAYEFGFEAEDIPLVIEAVPIGADCIVLIVTKVDDPEELDTRFSRFSPSLSEGEEDYEDEDEDEDFELLEDSASPYKSEAPSGNQQFRSIPDVLTGKEKDSDKKTEESRQYRFSSLDQVVSAAEVLGSAVKCPNTLYRDPSGDAYILLVYGKKEDKTAFSKLCNELTEFGIPASNSNVSSSYLDEHYDAVIRKCALQDLAKI